jgi:hypothetical protein
MPSMSSAGPPLLPRARYVVVDRSRPRHDHLQLDVESKYSDHDMENGDLEDGEVPSQELMDTSTDHDEPEVSKQLLGRFGADIH